jgi:hypothetical protein
MTGRTSFSTLRKRMPPEAQARSRAKCETLEKDMAYDNAMERLNGRMGLLATTDRAVVMAYDGPVIAGRVPMVGLFSLLSDGQKNAALSFDDQA